MQEKRYIKNTVILFISMAITKIVGALFKIPLANLLGGTGMGYFSTAYGLYSPIFALTAAGIPTVMMRITARYAAAGDRKYAFAVRKVALVLFTAIGVAGSAAIIVFARFFAVNIACSPQSTLAVMCISPAVMLCCTASVLRGYREGLSNVMPSAAASVAEAVSRAVFGLGLSYSVIIYAKNAFQNGKSVFGNDVSTLEQAFNAALPYAAAGAILAVSISELCGLLAMIVIDRRYRKSEALPPRCDYCRRDICLQLMKETAPIAASALVMNCVSFVDLLTVTRALSASVAKNPEYYSSAFGNIFASCGGLEGLPNFMYGSYTGIAMSLFMLIPSFAGMTEKTAAPEIAAAWERKDGELICDKITMQLRAGALIACPACFGAAALAKPIMSMLYRSRTAEVSVALNSFIILCMGGIFMVTASAMFGIFQSINKAHIPLFLMMGSVAVKLLLNPLFISIPQLNISGAPLAGTIGYIIMTVCGGKLLNDVLPKKINILSAVYKPLVCGIICGFSAYITYSLLENRINPTLNVLFSVSVGAIVYLISLILVGIFRKNGKITPKIQKNFKNPLQNLEK